LSDEARDAIVQRAKTVVRTEATAVARIAEQLDGTFLAVMDLLLRCEGKVIVSGAGTSGTIARRMAHLLSVCGTPSFFLDPSDGLHGSLGAVAPGDVLIGLSKGGETNELTELITRAGVRGARTVALTAIIDSPMGRAADLTVRIDSDEADPGSLIAMGSTLAAAAWGDALAQALMVARNYSWEDLLFAHPGGAVGKYGDDPPGVTGR
jgi:D-arabinose 5-phosphate isomerase GutQ